MKDVDDQLEVFLDFLDRVDLSKLADEQFYKDMELTEQEFKNKSNYFIATLRENYFE